MLVIPKGIPAKVAKAAEAVFCQYRQGEIHPRRANYNRNVQVLDVGLYYRLLCRKGTKWELMSHSKYNNMIN